VCLLWEDTWAPTGGLPPGAEIYLALQQYGQRHPLPTLPGAGQAATVVRWTQRQSVTIVRGAETLVTTPLTLPTAQYPTVGSGPVGVKAGDSVGPIIVDILVARYMFDLEWEVAVNPSKPIATLGQDSVEIEGMNLEIGDDGMVYWSWDRFAWQAGGARGTSEEGEIGVGFQRYSIGAKAEYEYDVQDDLTVSFEITERISIEGRPLVQLLVPVYVVAPELMPKASPGLNPVPVR
jgi:hypothetical protein